MSNSRDIQMHLLSQVRSAVPFSAVKQLADSWRRYVCIMNLTGNRKEISP